MATIKNVLVIVELWSEDKILSFQEVSISIPETRPINQRHVTDASQRAVANALDLLKNNLDNQ